MQQIRERCPGVVTILITAHGSVRSAVDAMKLGAFDYIAKPFDMDQMRAVVRKAVEGRRARARSPHAPGHRHRHTSRAWWSVLCGGLPVVHRVADSRATVLLRGESGTGKELIARALHHLSSRARRPFIPVAAAALSEELLESELFGHEKGSFTGAANQRVGRFEEANGGTLFLDEIGDISHSCR